MRNRGPPFNKMVSGYFSGRPGGDRGERWCSKYCQVKQQYCHIVDIGLSMLLIFCHQYCQCCAMNIALIVNFMLLILFMLSYEHCKYLLDYCQYHQYFQVKQRGKAGCALTRTNYCLRRQDGRIEGGIGNAKYVNVKFQWRLCKC